MQGSPQMLGRAQSRQLLKRLSCKIHSHDYNKFLSHQTKDVRMKWEKKKKKAQETLKDLLH